MVKKRTLIIVGILIAATIGLLIFSFITGNVISENPEQEMKEEYFRIDNFGSEINEEVNLDDTQNSGGPE